MNMRPLLILLIVLCAARAPALDLLVLESLEGERFAAEIERLASDPGAVAEVRQGAAKTGKASLLAGMIIARADHPQVFLDFAGVIRLADRDGGLWRGEPPQDFTSPHYFAIKSLMRHWSRAATTPQAILDWESNKGGGDQPVGGRREDGPWRFWPALMFGLSVSDKQLRPLVEVVMRAWVKESGYSEISLEAFRWLCERSDHDGEVVLNYSVAITAGLKSEIPAADKARLALRQISEFEREGQILKRTNRAAILQYMSSAENFGDDRHAVILRRAADRKEWNEYREQMLAAAGRIEAK